VRILDEFDTAGNGSHWFACNFCRWHVLRRDRRFCQQKKVRVKKSSGRIEPRNIKVAQMQEKRRHFELNS